MNHQGSLGLLIQKIKILRKKLISYGYSSCEVNDIILDNFLNVPCHLDWYDLSNTNSLYLLKENLELDSSESELVMCLAKFFNSQKKGEVPEVFLDIIESNSTLFGIDLNNSSSDSNEQQSYSITAARRFQRTLSKPDRRKVVLKRNRQAVLPDDPPRKKAHIEQTVTFKRPLQDREVLEEEKPDKKLKRQ